MQTNHLVGEPAEALFRATAWALFIAPALVAKPASKLLGAPVCAMINKLVSWLAGTAGEVLTIIKRGFIAFL